VTNGPQAQARPEIQAGAAHRDHTAEVPLAGEGQKSPVDRWIVFFVGLFLGAAAGFLAGWLVLG
jgi:hypothetical protein